MKRNYYILSITFILLIGGFSLWNLVTPIKGFSETENRFLSPFPNVSLDGILDGTFNKEFEIYTSDQFPMRDSFITLHVMVETLIGKKDINNVFIGKDGYLLEKKNTINETQLTKNITTLDAFFQLLEKKNIAKKAMIVPTSSYVLKDKLPRFASIYNQDEIFSKLHGTLGADFLNTYPKLSEYVDQSIYYTTDHHWTTLGAYYAYESLCADWNLAIPRLEDYSITSVSSDFYGTIYSKLPLPWIASDTMEQFVEDTPFHITYDLNEVVYSLYDLNALATRDMYTYYLGGNHAIVEIETQLKNGQHLLIIKDSFAHSFIPFLTKNFETITVLDYRYYNSPVNDILDTKGITHTLVLYNALNFAEEKTFSNIIS